MHRTWRPEPNHVTMRFFVVPLLLLIALVPVFLPGTAHAAATHKAALPLKKHSWNVVPSPSPDQQYNQLFGVAALSPTDVWAVGYSGNGPQALTEQWNGTKWNVVPTPSIGITNELLGVAAVNKDDVWAVGYYYSPNTFVEQTLTEQWNGQVWNIIPSPDPSYGVSFSLSGVTAISANDIWAVGTGTDPNTNYEQTMTIHWNGASWSVVSSPNPTANNLLTAVTAVSSTDVWAVGYGTSSSNVYQTLALHWNGTNWSAVSSPSPGSVLDNLYGVTAISSTNVWAVGSEMNVSGNYQTLILHWDGNQWNLIASPDPGLLSNWLYGVTALSANDIWAVGTQSNGNNYNSQTLTLRWTGSSWKVVSSPNANSYNILNSVVMLSSGSSWAVGYTLDSGYSHRYTLTEHYH